MTTFDESGTLLDITPPGAFARHVDSVTKLAALHRVVAGIEPSKNNLFAALGLLALIGAAYYVSQNESEPTLIFDDDDTDDTDDDEPSDDD